MVFRPAGPSGFHGRAARPERASGSRPRDRAAARTLRRRERGGDGLSRAPAAGDRRDPGAGGRGLRAGRRGRDRRRRASSSIPSRTSRAPANKLSGMRRVVKLGSSVVADADGTPRLDVLAGVCDELAPCMAPDEEVIVVTSGAIARGMGVMAAAAAARARSTSCRRPARSARASSTRSTTSCCGNAGVPSAQVLLTFFDMSARTHYLNARQTLRKLLEWRVVPVINENDTTTTDEISFGDNDFLAAQVAILLGAERAAAADRRRRRVHRRPADPPRRRARRRGRATSHALDELEIGHTDLAARAPAGCAPRWWPPRWRRRPGSRR